MSSCQLWCVLLLSCWAWLLLFGLLPLHGVSSRKLQIKSSALAVGQSGVVGRPHFLKCWFFMPFDFNSMFQSATSQMGELVSSILLLLGVASSIYVSLMVWRLVKKCLDGPFHVEYDDEEGYATDVYANYEQDFDDEGYDQYGFDKYGCTREDIEAAEEEYNSL